VSVTDEWVRSNGRTMLTGGIRSTFSTINAIWNGLESKPRPRVKRPTTPRLTHWTDSQQCRRILSSSVLRHTILLISATIYWWQRRNVREDFFNLHERRFSSKGFWRESDIHMSVHRNIITNYSQQDVTFLKFIYFYRRSTCFRRFLRPSSGAHNCTYSFRYCQPILLLAATVDEMDLLSISSTVAASRSIAWQYLKLYVQLCAPDDGRRNRLKHVERL